MLVKNPVTNFPALCRDAAGYSTVLPEKHKDFKNILVAGMGGSAISGNIIKDFLRDRVKVPMEVARSFSLPKYADNKTLLLCVSYSGNTKETLNCFEHAMKSGCKTVVISSGGEISRRAKDQGLPLITIPGGMQPRDAFPFLFFSTLNCLKEAGIIDYDYAKIWEFLERRKDECTQEAEAAAEKILGTIPFIYGTSEGICMRLKAEINENAKMHAKFEVYPEVNHNEVVGWQGKTGRISAMFLRGLDENSDVSKTMDFLTEEIERENKAKVIQIKASGSNWLERAFYLIYTGDLLSHFLAEKSGAEREEVEFIEKIKSL